MKRIVLAITAVTLMSSCAHVSRGPRAGDEDSIRFAWTQHSVGGAQVRAVVDEGSPCPPVLVDGRAIVMTHRRATGLMENGYPAACQASLPKAARSASIGDRHLPVPARAVRRIVVIGDTGCRLTNGEDQGCTGEWPFPAIAEAAARMAPDLVIHVGDFYYREKCAEGRGRCIDWPRWRADFFDPASPLLAAAPWIMARGNHESCSRAGFGWSLYLDPANGPPPCPDGTTPPFAVDIGGLTIEVPDTSAMSDQLSGEAKAAWLANQEVSPHHQGKWMVTHKPPFVHGYRGLAANPLAPSDGRTLSGVSLVLAGHLHLFSAMDFGGVRPAQIIAGNSGTRLMVAARQETLVADQASQRVGLLRSRKVINGVPADISDRTDFGFLLMERVSHGADRWRITLFATDGRRQGRCDLTGRRIACR